MTALAPLRRRSGPSRHGPSGSGASGAGPSPRGAEARAGRAHADDLAVWSFVSGLAGLLVGNLVLGPCALALGALARGTGRRGRALLGLVLGAADLLVLVTLAVANGTLSWAL
ncbi:DUF4190 domain-containing protein [Streptomyces sp. AJS327]|uniref:DUF4190 domain-containing protein n=1 Tax=Streptomyces sp. AJS327 TaxID=2545265 RepID=UPI0015DE157F|nr:DUF4190 domain-containing protein [Streptomyces sp. AJS327]MBA0050614.1 DUF4190 domain-containing protein [Streptomyces sp. AJS327]